jgi:iron-sulfur cluster assembly protein
MLHLSEIAAKKISTLRGEENRSNDYFLRIEVKKGGCAGLSYKMNFDADIKASDKIFENHGEKIVIDPSSFMYLVGMTLDYQGGLNGKGFIFSNPNAAKSCGCGTSFNIAKAAPVSADSKCTTDS